MKCVFCGDESHHYSECPEKITPHSYHIYATPIKTPPIMVGNIALPEDSRTTAPKRARIIAIDPKIKSEEVKVGDLILYPANLAWRINERLFRIFESNIYGVITEE